MKIGIFSDLHLTKGGKKVDIWDKKTLDGLNVLNQVIGIFVKHKVDKFIFCGDFFNERYRIDVQILTGAVKILVDMKDIPGVFIPGNHDLYYTKENYVNSLVTYSLKWEIIDNIVRDNDFVYLPFLNKIGPEIYKQLNGKYLFCHQFLKGFPIQNDYVPVEDVIDYTKVNCEWIFAGHSHVPYRKGKFISLGSVMDLSFADSPDIDKGCYIFDTETEDLQFFKLDYPKYIKVDDVSMVKDNYNYYRLVMNESDFTNIKVSENVQVQLVQKEEKINRLELSEHWTEEELIRKYVEKVYDKDDKEKIINVGLEILKELKQYDNV
jgi:DNA repair exonuclease SbcCD nuclease subunit